jgi:hypothetical protein
MEYKTFRILVILGLEVSYKREMICNNCYPSLEGPLETGLSHLDANYPKLVGRYLSLLENLI